MNRISLIKETEETKGMDNQGLIENFHEFLQDDKEGIKLSPEDAFKVIMYLQETLPVIPCTLEFCNNCKGILDTFTQGYYSEERGIHLCYMCDDGED